jgi:hypothetical protein
MVRGLASTRTIAVLVVMLFLGSTLTTLPILFEKEEFDLPTTTASSGSTETSGSESPPEIPFEIVYGKSGAYAFGTSVANIGDVQGDKVDDLIIGEFVFDESSINTRKKPGNYVLPGRMSRGFNNSQLKQLKDMSQIWFDENQRGLGDVNGDGYSDVVSAPYWNFIWYVEDEIDQKELLKLCKLHIRYGSETGLPETPDLIIDISPSGSLPPEDEGWWWWWWPDMSYYSGVGDVNGDGYNDMCIYRIIRFHKEEERYGGEVEVWYWPEFDLQLLYGSKDGMSTTPGWNMSPRGELWDWIDYGPLFKHGDLNGDGYSDIILVSDSAPHISVFMGSKNGPGSKADQEISFSDSYFEDWMVHTPRDINGDKYDDIVLSYGDSEGLFSYIQYIYFFPGSANGIPIRPDKEFKIDTEEYSMVALLDVNKDGLDDVMTYNISTDGGYRNQSVLTFQLFFHTGSGYNRKPSWSYQIKDLNVEPSEMGFSCHSVGDFDGDGHGDLALGLVNPYDGDWYPSIPLNSSSGQVLLLFGGAIMDMLRPIKLIGGPQLFAGYKAYDFRVNVNPFGVANIPVTLTLTLDPNGADVELFWNGAVDGNPFTVISDPNGYINLSSGIKDAVHDTDNNTVWLHFRVLFDWDWPHEDPCDASVEWPVPHQPYVAEKLFQVENDLDFYGVLSVHGQWQGPLSEGDWIRVGENVTFSGPIVVYEGTTDVFPPDGVCDIMLSDNDGDSTTTHVESGKDVNLRLKADNVTDPDENLTLTLRNLPGTSTAISNPRFHLLVDGDAPTFRNAVPEEDFWHSSSEVFVSITADDTGTSGVRASTLAYQYSTNGGLTYTDWTRDKLETTSDGETVDGLVTITLPDGADNFVRWRAMDIVGNGNSISDAYRIRVDTKNVTFTDAFPAANAWQTTRSIECGVTIQDISGAGIDVTRIMYRVSYENLSHYGAWVDFDEGSMETQEIVTVQVLLELGESGYNYVQWRAFDIAGNGDTTSPHYRVRVDATPIEFSDFEPTEPQATRMVQWWANVSDKEGGSGVDMTMLMYRYRTTGGDWSTWIDLQMDGEQMRTFISDTIELPDGSENVMQFRGVDVAGNGPTLSDEYVILVDTTAPVFLGVTPGPDEKQPDPSVTVTVTLMDAVIGLDISGVEYRFGTDGEGSMGEWTQLPVDTTDGGFIGTVALDLARGKDNVVQFKAVDILGNEGVSEVATIWVNRVPTAVISSPKADVEYKEGEKVSSPKADVEYKEGEKVLLNASGSQDADGDKLNYTWYVEGQTEPLAYGKELEMTLPVGLYNLTLVVKDTDDAAATTGVYVNVKHLPPPTSKTESWVGLLVLLIIVFLLVAGLTYYLQSRKVLTQVEEDSYETRP